MTMTGREIVKRCLAFDGPERIGMDFIAPHPRDIAWTLAADLQSPLRIPSWGRDPALTALLPDFRGEMFRDVFGVVYGRLDGIGNGEPVWSPLTEGIEAVERLTLPTIDRASTDARLSRQTAGDRFVLGILESAPFSTMRGLRGLDDHLADTLLDPEAVRALNGRLESLSFDVIRNAARLGVDGICVYEDWGTQTALLMSPSSWRELYKPMYRRLADLSHDLGMAFFVHSCGAVRDIVGDFVEIGTDAFNFDQPELHGIERLAEDHGGKVTFWCPVDIQKTLPTGDRALIEARARDMLRLFGGKGGGFIAKDYPSLEAIGVKDEWADWARQVFIREGVYGRGGAG